MFTGKGIAKAVLAGVICFGGVLAGIYVGSAYILDRPVSSYGINENTTGEQASYLQFGVGDSFPHEVYETADHRQGSFEDLLADKNSLVFLIEPGCPPCVDLLKFWKDRIKKRLNPGVQMVAVIEKDMGRLADEYAALLEQMDAVVWIDGAKWREVYHATFWPTIVGVDVGGFVVHEQFGFDGTIDRGLVDYFIQPSQK